MAALRLPQGACCCHEAGDLTQADITECHSLGSFTTDSDIVVLHAGEPQSSPPQAASRVVLSRPQVETLFLRPLREVMGETC